MYFCNPERTISLYKLFFKQNCYKSCAINNTVSRPQFYFTNTHFLFFVSYVIWIKIILIKDYIYNGDLNYKINLIWIPIVYIYKKKESSFIENKCWRIERNPALKNWSGQLRYCLLGEWMTSFTLRLSFSHSYVKTYGFSPLLLVLSLVDKRVEKGKEIRDVRSPS